MKKKVIKMSKCLAKCKNSTDCRNDVKLSRKCNQCIYDTCREYYLLFLSLIAIESFSFALLY